MIASKLPFLIISLFFFLVFILFSYIVHKDLLINFDLDTTVKLQNNISRQFDTLFSSLSLFGSLEVLSLVLLILLLIKRKFKTIILPISYVALHAIELYGKIFVNHSGPPFMFFRYDIHFLFPSSYVSPGYSYPSGHSARTVFISTVLIYLILKSNKIPKSLKIIMLGAVLLFDLVMLVSRVYLGEHWTTDVIGGAFLGLSLAIFSLYFL